MNKNNLIVFIIIILIGSTMYAWYSRPKEVQIVKEPIPYECNTDAKVCPDGSTVGRTGSDCQFQQCPSVENKEASVVTSMGQVSTAMNLSITPNKLVSDSRCPIDVQCIWAGTVEVKAVTTNQVSYGEQVFKLGEEKVFGDYTITLSEVNPVPKSKIKIPDSVYRFTFLIKKK